MRTAAQLPLALCVLLFSCISPWRGKTRLRQSRPSQAVQRFQNPPDLTHGVRHRIGRAGIDDRPLQGGVLVSQGWIGSQRLGQSSLGFHLVAAGLNDVNMDSETLVVVLHRTQQDGRSIEDARDVVHHLTRPASSNGIAQLPDHVGGPRVPVTHFDRVARVRPDLHSIDRPQHQVNACSLIAVIGSRTWNSSTPSDRRATALLHMRIRYLVILNSVGASASPDGDRDASANACQLISSDTRSGGPDAPQRHARDVMSQRPTSRFSSVFIGRLDALGERPVGETLVSGQGNHQRVGILVRVQFMILDDHCWTLPARLFRLRAAAPVHDDDAAGRMAAHGRSVRGVPISSSSARASGCAAR